MIGGLSLGLLVLAQAPASVPPPAQEAAPAEPSPASRDCNRPSANDREIVICAERTDDGYRLNPDLMEARREARSAGRPNRPGGKTRPDCASVGPAPCMVGGISLIGVVLTAAEMAKRVAQGKEIGNMFATDPHPSEYQLYLMAKARREAREAEEADAKAAAKVKPATSSKPAAERSPPPSPSGR